MPSVKDATKKQGMRGSANVDSTPTTKPKTKQQQKEIADLEAAAKKAIVAALKGGSSNAGKALASMRKKSDK